MGTVDTLKAYEALTSASMPDNQARALVAIVNELQEARLADVATKIDITALQHDNDLLRSEVDTKLARLEGKIDRIKSDLESKIESSKNSLLKWVIPILAAQIGLSASILLRIIK